jgi:hypothetical protein
MGFWIPGMRTGIVTGNPADGRRRARPARQLRQLPQGRARHLHCSRTSSAAAASTRTATSGLRQRKNASLEFTKRSLRKFVVDVVQAEVAGRLLPLLRRNASGAGGGAVIIDLQDVLELSRSTPSAWWRSGTTRAASPTAG